MFAKVKQSQLGRQQRTDLCEFKATLLYILFQNSQVMYIASVSKNFKKKDYYVSGFTQRFTMNRNKF